MVPLKDAEEELKQVSKHLALAQDNSNRLDVDLQGTPEITCSEFDKVNNNVHRLRETLDLKATITSNLRKQVACDPEKKAKLTKETKESHSTNEAVHKQVTEHKECIQVTRDLLRVSEM